MTISKLVNKIHNQDCIVGMQRLPAECASLVIADPPYNLNKDFGTWNENERREEWLPWSKQWIDEVKRISRPGGNIFVYGIHHHLCWLQCYMYEIGLSYRRQIIWYYENGFAGYSKRTLAAHYEPILWFSNGNKYTYHPIREAYKSENRLKYKITKNGKVWSPNPEGRLAGDVWRFPTLAGRRFRDEKVSHPTQKPLSISLRIVKYFSDEGDLVVIPFAGSGTECVAAKMENRRFIGFELNPEYIQIAEKRLQELQK
ncbi:MAG: site-specific DNA-methyltransferase [Dehalococcoidia bacterium]|jgi:site-specific DNA-methyltransferase (adenine-specific)/adenine-specific DNA-methyltransferase